MKRLKLFFPALVMVFLGACATGSPQAQSQKAVDAYGQTLGVLGQMVTVYDNYPDCGPRIVGLCATPTMRVSLANAMIGASDAYIQAEGLARAGGTPSTVALAAALNVLQNLTAQLPPQK